MTLDSINSYSYTAVSAAVFASVMIHPQPGTPTIHKAPFIFLNNSYSIILESALSEDQELTLMGMLVSEKSLAKDWENEDDARWNKFLINE